MAAGERGDAEKHYDFAPPIKKLTGHEAAATGFSSTEKTGVTSLNHLASAAKQRQWNVRALPI